MRLHACSLIPIFALALGTQSFAQFIRPDTADAGSEFGPGYFIENAISGAGLRPDFSLATIHAGYNGGNHWTTANGALGAGDAFAVFGFNQEQTLNRFHLWNHRSDQIASVPYYAVTQFDLEFFDAAGATLLVMSDLQAPGGVGDGSAQTFDVPTVSGVRSVLLRIDANSEPPGYSGVSYTGLAEVAFSFVEAVNYCTSSPNSSGAAAEMSVSGSTRLSDAGLTLEARGMPVGSFGIFVVSQTTGASPLASGTLCLGGAIGRYQDASELFQVNGVGRASLAIDLSAIPQPSQVVAVTAGETWHFQGWFRDVVAGQQTANLTDGISVTYQ